jgi:hypothetical protein
MLRAFHSSLYLNWVSLDLHHGLNLLLFTSELQITYIHPLQWCTMIQYFIGKVIVLTWALK